MYYQRNEIQELLEHLLRNYSTDAQLLDRIGRFLGLNVDETRRLLCFFEKGEVVESSPATCIKLLNVLLKKLGIRPMVVIKGDVSKSHGNVACIIISSKGENTDVCLMSLYNDIKYAFIELFNTLYLVMPRPFKTEDGFLGVWKFKNLENYVHSIRGFIRGKISEILTGGYIVFNDRAVLSRFQKIDLLCRDISIVLYPDMLKDGMIYSDLKFLIESSSPYYRCYIASDVDKTVIGEILFSMLFDLVVDEIRKGLSVDLGEKLKILSLITGVQEIINIKPFIEIIKHEIENSHLDFIKILEEIITVERDIPKRMAREDFILKFLQHQVSGKKPFNDVNLGIYLLFHILISQILLYRLICDPENINGYFVTYYKHLTEVLYNILGGLQYQVRKGLFDHISFDLGNVIEALKSIRDNVGDYPGLMTAISKHIGAQLPMLLGNLIEGEKPLFIEVVRKDSKGSIISIVTSGAKGRFYFTLAIQFDELTKLMLSLILELIGNNVRRGLIASNDFKDKERVRESISNIRNNLRQPPPLTGNINIMPIEDAFWSILS